MRDHNIVEELRGVGRLAVEATRGVTDLVESMHIAIASGPDLLGRPLAGATRALTGPIYGSIRGVTSLVGASLDLALAQLAPLFEGGGSRRPEHEALLAGLNGVLGDYLSETNNPLALPMRLRSGGQPLTLEREALAAAFPQAGGRVLVLVHGSCMNDLLWTRRDHDHGAALARDLGATPIYLHYNSGLQISTNGRAFAAQLEQLVGAWPVAIEELIFVAHSMGGLVCRSACHAGELAGHRWRARLQALVCLGSPHHGAPLERGGNWVDLLLGATRYSAPLARLGQIRSAGVTDLRFGNVLDEHWRGRDRFAARSDQRTPLPLPDGVRCYAVAATRAAGPGATLPGDGLVPVDSALGRHVKPELTLRFPAAHQSLAFGLDHLDLLSDLGVYATLRAWLAAA